MIEDVNNYIIIIDRKLSINRVKAQRNLEIYLTFGSILELSARAQFFSYQNVLRKFPVKTFY